MGEFDFEYFVNRLLEAGWTGTNDAQRHGARKLYNEWFPLESKIEVMKSDLDHLEGELQSMRPGNDCINNDNW
jgi:hypothetical protein